VSGALIESAKYNAVVNDIATGLSTAIAKDGQTTITANLPMAGYRHTGVGNAVSRTDYAAMGQAQDSSFTWAGTAGGTADAITLTLTPAISAYAAGQSFTYKSGASANTGAMTVNINGVGAKAIQKTGSALAAGDHPANSWFRITYDGAAFQLTQIALVSANVTASLALKADLASPTLTGTPAAPTAAADTNTTQIATTAFMIGQAASVAPLIDASSAAVGTSKKYARQDHVHPASALGVGQAYQNVTASRAVGGGPYTNSAGRPIAISVSCLINAADAYLNVTVNGSVVGFSTQTYASGKAAILPFFIIPTGATYSVATSTGTASSLTWIELA
jgi:hypothetical protein